jgi:hypothetical protein
MVQQIDVAIEAVTRLRSALHKGHNRQVRSREERSRIKATALAWVNNVKPTLVGFQHDVLFAEIDKDFSVLLEWSDQNATRTKYRVHLKQLREKLVRLRSRGILAPPASVQAPDFGGLIGDARMVAILQRRWKETLDCRGVGAHLAATVMLGGLLEALFLARINRLSNKATVFTAKTAPKDKQGNPRSLKEWGLKDFLDVANELGWIRQSAKDVGEVLRDYRNFIHPEKEFSHGINLNGDDTRMFVTVFCSIADQVIASAKGP